MKYVLKNEKLLFHYKKKILNGPKYRLNFILNMGVVYEPDVYL